MFAEFEARKANCTGQVFINPAEVVSVAVTSDDLDTVYVELTSGNTFPVAGPIEDVLHALTAGQ
jgi:hypothetical protein